MCPAGWHVPNYEEWTTLTEYLGGYMYAGWKLIETGTTHWSSPNTGATNESGFTALPGGSRQGSFGGLGVTGSWWSSTATDYNDSFAWYLHLYSNNSAALMLTTFRTTGYSVRCIKDN